MCRGKNSGVWSHLTLTLDEFHQVINAAGDVCPQVLS
jgi:hypothetical protein